MIFSIFLGDYQKVLPTLFDCSLAPVRCQISLHPQVQKITIVLTNIVVGE